MFNSITQFLQHSKIATMIAIAGYILIPLSVIGYALYTGGDPPSLKVAAEPTGYPPMATIDPQPPTQAPSSPPEPINKPVPSNNFKPRKTPKSNIRLAQADRRHQDKPSREDKPKHEEPNTPPVMDVEPLPIPEESDDDQTEPPTPPPGMPPDEEEPSEI